jgi:uncharacterized membrane protein
MGKLISVGRVFFAVALMGMGAEHFIYKDFIVGRAPQWPEVLPGKLPWAYATGITFILIGVAVIIDKKARPALIIASALVFAWAFIRHIPIVISSPLLGGEWTGAGKALTFFGGGLAIASTFQKENIPAVLNDRDHWFVIAGRLCLGTFMTISGIQHFMYIAFVASLIPSWFPGNAVFWSKLGGVALIAGGVGLFIPKTAQLAAGLSGLMIFLWFWIVHIPRVTVSVSDNIAVFEALAVTGIALVLAGIPDAKNEL